jgi:thymidylate kinase
MYESPRYGDCAHLLLFADLIAKARRVEQGDGDIVVVDRYCDSWLCYTLASPDKTLLSDDLVRTLYARFRAFVDSGVVHTVYLRLTAEEAAHRLQARDHRSDTPSEKERLRRISTLFDQLYSDEDVIRVDACQDRDAVTEAILKSLKL